MDNPFKNYLSRAQIAAMANVKVKATREWDLPEPDYRDAHKHYWLKSKIIKWLKDVESGKIKKTKIANKA